MIIIVELKPKYYLLDNQTGAIGTFDKGKARNFDSTEDAGLALTRARDYEKFQEAIIIEDFYD